MYNTKYVYSNRDIKILSLQDIVTLFLFSVFHLLKMYYTYLEITTVFSASFF